MLLRSQARKASNEATSTSPRHTSRNQQLQQPQREQEWPPQTRQQVHSRQEYTARPQNSFYRQESENYQEDEDEEDWRRGAQMLSEADEMRLLLAGSPRSPPPMGEDVLDVAPVNRRRPQSQSPVVSGQRQGSSGSRQPPRHHKLAFFTASPSPTRSHTREHQEPHSFREVGAEEDKEEEEEGEEFALCDDNSSISFAQSGCHSILSAWRVKAANRAARLSAAAARPVSVLSGVSAATATGKSPASQTRIPLGPKSAQHFVTNTRRRRRANELILNTLEARRRAMNSNRHSVGLLPGGCGSLFGSESYLAEPGAAQAAALLVDPDYQRLSLSPSPLKPQQQIRANRSPSPAQTAASRALSDLGGRRKGEMMGGSERRAESPAAMLAQRQRLLNAATLKTLSAGKRKPSSEEKKPPPLARLDQNSSDLASNPSSSSGDEDDESSSSGSQFTQLVTSELAPDCVLLDEQALRARLAQQQANANRPTQSTLPRLSPPVAGKPPVPARPSPPVPRARQSNLKEVVVSGPAQQRQQLASQRSTARDELGGGSFRRGALKRDSIRRLRLSRAAAAAAAGDSTSSSENSPGQNAGSKTQPLSKARKLDLETNPFLNRHHFRSLSTRSTASECAYRQQQQDGASLLSSEQASRASEAGSKGSPPTEQSLARSASSRSTSAAPKQQRQQPREEKPPTGSGASSVHEHILSARSAPRNGDEIKRVEQILRQMKPGEVLKSSSRENLASTSVMQQQQQQQQQYQKQPVEAAERVHKQAQQSSAPQPPRRSKLAGQRQQRQQSPTDETKPNEFKTTTRLVREGARSRDDLKFDAQGNRRQLELEERWRHERVEPVHLADGSVFSERKYLNERLQLQRVTSSTIEKLSPPAGFADAASDAGVAPQARARDRLPPTSLVEPPRPARSFQSEAARRLPSGALTQPAQAPAASQSRQAPPLSQAKTTGSLFSESKSNHRQQPTQSGQRSLGGEMFTSPSEQTNDAPAHLLRKHQAQLPKFERSADDEFRKRVDQLRQMARANLQSSGQQMDEVIKARQIRLQQQTVKPLSTNWRGPEVVDTGAQGPESALSAGQESSPLSRPAAGRQARVTSTNLDDMLLADRYQRQPPLGSWRRSNSSLASIGRSQEAESEPQQRPAMSGSQQSIVSQSELSTEPRQDSVSSPMRLVVREKTGPSLGVASVVEHRQKSQQSESSSPSAEERRTVPAAATPAARRVMATGVARPLVAAPSYSPPHAAKQQAPPTPTANYRQVARSPRSPELGGQAVSSSNDDSAIASSVSSPSLSFTAHQQAQARQQAVAPPSPSPSQPQPQRACQQAAQPPPGRQQLEQVIISSQPTSGALQSILRRQQQQQQNALQTEERAGHLDSSKNAEQQCGPISRTILRPSSPLQSSIAGSQLQAAAKRVHFNERASIRSFESISSLAESEATEVAANEQLHAGNDLARRLIGSPDSMGSASSASRLSGESSDSFGRSAAARQQQAGGGAAIYAVRGDPELELSTGPQQQQQQQSPALDFANQRQQVATAGQQQARALLAQQQQFATNQQPQMMHYSAQSTASSLQQRHLTAGQRPHQQRQPYTPPLGLSIRMTAPPSISTSAAGALSPVVSPQQQQQYLQQMFGQATALGPAQRALQPMVQRVPPAAAAPDDDDQEYALRLRQAATSRALFSAYAQQQPIATNARQLSSPTTSATAAATTTRPGRAPRNVIATPQAMSQQQQQQAQKRCPSDLRNFHTEV